MRRPAHLAFHRYIIEFVSSNRAYCLQDSVVLIIVLRLVVKDMLFPCCVSRLTSVLVQDVAFSLAAADLDDHRQVMDRLWGQKSLEYAL